MKIEISLKVTDKVKVVNLENSVVKHSIVPIGSVGVIEEVRPSDESWHPISVCIEPHGVWFFNENNLELI